MREWQFLELAKKHGVLTSVPDKTKQHCPGASGN